MCPRQESIIIGSRVFIVINFIFTVRLKITSFYYKLITIFRIIIVFVFHAAQPTGH